MKISNSKKELARIISENGGWRDGANLALFGKVSGRCYLLRTDERPEYEVSIKGFYINGSDVISDFTASPFANWHQTILSREEYLHLYPDPDADGWIEWSGGACPVDDDELTVEVKRADDRIGSGCAGAMDWAHYGTIGDVIAYRLYKPEQAEAPAEGESPEQHAKLAIIHAPTLDQLLQDWRNADDYAQRKQTEADEAAAMRDERWQAVQARAGEVGVTVGRREKVATADDNGWIEWDGGECPVPRDTLVDIRLRDGWEETSLPANRKVQGRNPDASSRFWKNDNHPRDIVAYRLARP